MSDGKRHEVIFQVHAGERGWLDYCRETAPSPYMNAANRFGKEQCDQLERREHKPFRFIVEIWN